MKLTIKINLLFSIIVSCILLGMALLIYHVSRDNVNHDFRQRMKTRAARSAYLYNLFKKDTTSLLDSMDANSPTLLYNKSIYIFDTSFLPLYSYNDAGLLPLQFTRSLLEKAKKDHETYAKDGKRIMAVYRFDESRYNLLVGIAAEDSTGNAYINSLKRVFLLYVPLAILLTLLAGYLFSRTIVRPVRETIDDVKLITSQNLSHRLYTGQGKDELTELNNTFNDLLNRLEESFAIEKRFIANASHELSTPLTAISSQIDVALMQERDTVAYKNILYSVLKDVQGLHELTRTLLEIARAGSNGEISLEKLRIDEVLIKAHTELLRQHGQYAIELAMAELPEDEAACQVFGNAQLLSSAFKNIMENGCKYSPDRKTSVQLIFEEKDVRLFFNNKSAYMDRSEIEKLFEPFYRGSNVNSEPGVGLGLTLTRRIIRLHKGTLSIKSNADSGTSIKIVLPTLKK